MSAQQTLSLETAEKMIRDADFSDCGLYRYQLMRVWDLGKPLLLWVMLNPSTADGKLDDATIRRCMGFARRWGFGGIVVVNLFAFRATDPAAMKRAADPCGPANLLTVRMSCALVHRDGGKVVCAWGNDGDFQGRSKRVVELLRADGIPLHYLRLTAKGEPCHPLYLPNSLELTLWEP